MEEDIELRGQWWVAGSDTRWPGRFSWSTADGPVLDVDARHGEIPYPPSADEFPLIYGETIDGKAITLVESFQTSANMHMPGGVEASFSARYAIVGAWFESSEELRFSCLTFRLSDLDAWIGVSGFRVDRLASTGFSLSYEVPDSLEIGDAPAVRIHADFRASGGPRFARPLIEVALHQRVRLRLATERPTPLPDLIELVRQTRNFFSFVFRQQTRLLEVSVRAEIEVRRGGERTREEHDLAVYCKSDTDPTPRRPIERHRMLFRLEDCRELGESPLSRWLAKVDLLGPIYDLYLVGLYQPRIYLELQFLALAQALESLHSRKFPDYELPKAEHKERLAAILGSAPEKWREWQKRKLVTSNKASFRDGVVDLLKTLPPSLAGEIGDFDDCAARIGWTRNYLTHWNADLEKKAAKGEALFRLADALRLILEALLLLEIGFTYSDVEELLSSNHAIKHDIEYALGGADASVS